MVAPCRGASSPSRSTSTLTSPAPSPRVSSSTRSRAGNLGTVPPEQACVVLGLKLEGVVICAGSVALWPVAGRGWPGRAAALRGGRNLLKTDTNKHRCSATSWSCGSSDEPLRPLVCNFDSVSAASCLKCATTVRVRAFGQPFELLGVSEVAQSILVSPELTSESKTLLLSTRVLSSAPFLTDSKRSVF